MEPGQQKCKCKRCGKCCREQRDHWKQTEFKHPIIEMLRNLHPNFRCPEHCLMLRMEGDVAVCMLQELFGYEAKPEVCREYFCEEIKNG